MFDSTRAFSGFSVTDIAEAKRFYGEVLGLETSEANGMLQLTLGSGAVVLAYPKPNHEPASYTMMNLPVDDIEAAVDELASRGVTFQRYPQMAAETDERGIFHGGGPLIAWFTDPAGNILSVLEDPLPSSET
ncbi:VOC family protein [Rathayibacter soli]|uniref:VOC family protein n=1 Tax=Rathayibacter soli TaxID=3144168 RepID=UPI0027E48C70|nr:VOC family protein [Glaciibacter superstes]